MARIDEIECDLESIGSTVITTTQGLALKSKLTLRLQGERHLAVIQSRMRKRLLTPDNFRLMWLAAMGGTGVGLLFGFLAGYAFNSR